jgi:hypothetical protein
MIIQRAHVDWKAEYASFNIVPTLRYMDTWGNPEEDFFVR